MIRWNLLDMDTKGTESIVILQRLEFFIAHKIYSQVKLKNFLCMLIAWLGSGNMEKFWIKLQLIIASWLIIAFFFPEGHVYRLSREIKCYPRKKSFIIIIIIRWNLVSKH